MYETNAVIIQKFKADLSEITAGLKLEKQAGI
jgi:hypothetical protein